MPRAEFCVHWSSEVILEKLQFQFISDSYLKPFFQ